MVAEVLDQVQRAARPGRTTMDLDLVAADIIVKRHGVPSFKGFRGYPATICASVNDVVVHGIPGNDVLKPNDLVSIDVGVLLHGWHADAAVSFAVEAAEAETAHLLSATASALATGVAAVRAGGLLSGVGRAIEAAVAASGFTLVRRFGGHGIGRALHEEPHVLNYFDPEAPDMVLETGLVLALEPVVTAGADATRVLEDGWTVVTTDGRRAAHFEHTVALTDEGVEILTVP